MPSPLTHITGVVYALEMPFVLGCSVVLLDTWNPEVAIKLIEKEHCTFMVAATPFLQHMLDSPAIKMHDVSSLRLFACGGAAVPPELVERAWKEAGWRAMRVYGSTEAPTITWGIPKDGTMEKAARTDGKIAGYQVKIVDSEEKRCGSAKRERLPLGDQSYSLVIWTRNLMKIASMSKDISTLETLAVWMTKDISR